MNSILSPLQLLHWNTLKSIAISLSLLPISHFAHQCWFSAHIGFEQILLRFFTLSLLGTWFILAFIFALTCTQTTFHPEHRLVKYYRHLPMSFFTLMLLGLQHLWF